MNNSEFATLLHWFAGIMLAVTIPALIYVIKQLVKAVKTVRALDSEE